MKFIGLLIAMLFPGALYFGQVKYADLDSLNLSLQKNLEVNLSQFGKAKIKFKDGYIYKNCLIQTVKANYIVYLKNGVLHDQMIDKILRITFINYPLELHFDEKNKGNIKLVIESFED